MSYDVSFTIDAGGAEPACVGDDCLNHTWNCGEMFRKALGDDGIASLNGKIAGDELPRLRRAVAHIRDPNYREVYEKMNPPNGWGSRETATAFLEDILRNAIAYPKATIRVT